MTSSGLRPHLSTVTMATTVKITLAPPTMIVCSSAVSVEAPMFGEHQRCVVQHGVDADELLEHGDA